MNIQTHVLRRTGFIDMTFRSGMKARLSLLEGNPNEWLHVETEDDANGLVRDLRITRITTAFPEPKEGE